jgi:hypothetical protein
MKDSWLNRHTVPLIALGFLLFSFIVFRMVLLKEVRASDTTTASIIECIKGGIYLIFGYFFGSSIGSKDKQKIIDERKGEG